ncbi:hypothetical protein [Leptospira ilyithenensis]|nr:hypothetical protein [Leptospira ilyithenensis]
MKIDSYLPDQGYAGLGRAQATGANAEPGVARSRIRRIREVAFSLLLTG